MLVSARASRGNLVRTTPQFLGFCGAYSPSPAHRVSQRALAVSTAFTTRRCLHFVPGRSSRFPQRTLVMAAVAGQPPGESLETDEPRGEVQSFTVVAQNAGKRFDRVLADVYAGQSRSYFQALIDDGMVLVNGQPLRAKSRKTVEGDTVDVEFVTPARDLPLTAEDIPLDVLYEDDHIVVINKPPGMVVHPAPGNWTGTLVHALAFRYEDHLALGGARPGIVHRLDKGTSGVIICARTADAHRALTVLFAERKVEKTYLAVAVGNPAGDGCMSRVLDAPIGRSPVDRARMMVLEEDAGGRSARSIVKVHAIDARRLLHVVEVGLETGRTHQIRVHLRHARAPILGDDVYGAFDVNKRFRTSAPRPLLHAHRLRFQHPVTNQEVNVHAPLPDDMRGVVANVFPKFEQQEPCW